jgi:hypothetical protein
MVASVPPPLRDKSTFLILMHSLQPISNKIVTVKRYLAAIEKLRFA